MAERPIPDSYSGHAQRLKTILGLTEIPILNDLIVWKRETRLEILNEEMAIFAQLNDKDLTKLLRSRPTEFADLCSRKWLSALVWFASRSEVSTHALEHIATFGKLEIDQRLAMNPATTPSVFEVLVKRHDGRLSGFIATNPSAPEDTPLS